MIEASKKNEFSENPGESCFSVNSVNIPPLGPVILTGRKSLNKLYLLYRIENLYMFVILFAVQQSLYKSNKLIYAYCLCMQCISPIHTS